AAARHRRERDGAADVSSADNTKLHGLIAALAQIAPRLRHIIGRDGRCRVAPGVAYISDDGGDLHRPAAVRKYERRCRAEYFADGIVEDIITALCRIRNLAERLPAGRMPNYLRNAGMLHAKWKIL